MVRWKFVVRDNMFSGLSHTFRMAPSLTSYSRPNARLLGAFGLLNFAMFSHRWASVEWVYLKFHPLPVVIHRIIVSRKRYE
jgi:hypothetical protein